MQELGGILGLFNSANKRRRRWETLDLGATACRRCTFSPISQAGGVFQVIWWRNPFSNSIFIGCLERESMCAECIYSGSWRKDATEVIPYIRITGSSYPPPLHCKNKYHPHGICQQNTAAWPGHFWPKSELARHDTATHSSNQRPDFLMVRLPQQPQKWFFPVCEGSVIYCCASANRKQCPGNWIDRLMGQSAGEGGRRRSVELSGTWRENSQYRWDTPPKPNPSPSRCNLLPHL